MESLTCLSNESLTQTLLKLRIGEREVISDVVRYLAELDSRKLYLELGYSSLFSYCRGALGYSEGGAYRRIQAARLVRDNPEVYQKLRNGSLTLCALAEISKVKEGRAAVIEASVGKSKEEVQRIVSHYIPSSPIKREVVRVKQVDLPLVPLSSQPEITATVAVTKTVYTVTIEVDEECMELLKEAQNLTGVLKKAEVVKMRNLTDFGQSKLITSATQN